jgi:hypothetical protein
MKIEHGDYTRRAGAWMLQGFCILVVAGLVTVAARTAEAGTDRYDPQKAANPIRVAAYILHPVGVLLDYGLIRPCFWVVQREPFSTIFGYEHPWNDDRPDNDLPQED